MGRKTILLTLLCLQEMGWLFSQNNVSFKLELLI